jgi:hypothetical protein
VVYRDSSSGSTGCEAEPGRIGVGPDRVEHLVGGCLAAVEGEERDQAPGLTRVDGELAALARRTEPAEHSHHRRLDTRRGARQSRDGGRLVQVRQLRMAEPGSRLPLTVRGVALTSVQSAQARAAVDHRPLIMVG